MMLRTVFLVLPASFVVASAQGDCNGKQTCASAASASMLQMTFGARSDSEAVTTMNSSYSSTMWRHTTENQELFDLIKKKAAEAVVLYQQFINSEFMKKLCGDAGNWDCDPSKLTAEDLKALMDKFKETEAGQEVMKVWEDIQALMQQAMAWIKEVVDEWLPKLKQIVLETLEKLKSSGIEGYFNGNFNFEAFKELFQSRDGKSGFERFLEAAAYVAEELQASELVGQLLDELGKLVKKLQAAIMALPSDAIVDWAKESGLLDGLQNLETELDAFFEKIKEDFLNFENSKNYLEDPANKQVWEGKNFGQIVAICIDDLFGSDCATLTRAALEAGKVTIAWQALQLLNAISGSGSRLLQTKDTLRITQDPSVQAIVDNGVLNAESPKSDTAMSTEATKLNAQMQEVDKELQEKAPKSSSESLPFVGNSR